MYRHAHTGGLYKNMQSSFHTHRILKHPGCDDIWMACRQERRQLCQSSFMCIDHRHKLKTSAATNTHKTFHVLLRLSLTLTSPPLTAASSQQAFTPPTWFFCSHPYSFPLIFPPSFSPPSSSAGRCRPVRPHSQQNPPSPNPFPSLCLSHAC